MEQAQFLGRAAAALAIRPESATKKLKATHDKVTRGLKKLEHLSEGDLAIATVPRDEVWREDMVRLYRCRPNVDKPHPVPILIAYALVGRFQMIDFEADRSLVRKLLASGFDVYFIDWGLPGRAQRWHGIDDYVSSYLDRCVDVIRQNSRTERINLMGICQGGVFSTCYAALFPQKVRNLALTVTPLDFHDDLKEPQPGSGYMNGWARSMSALDVDDVIDVYGSAPGALVGFAFLMINPVSNMTKYTTDLIDVLDDDAKLLSFLGMERWIADRPDHPGEVLRQWLKDLYQDNKLIRNQLQLGGSTVDLRQITMPVLNIYATTYTVVPVSRSRGGAGIISARKITPNWQSQEATSGPLSAAKHRKFWGPCLPNGLPYMTNTTMQFFLSGCETSGSRFEPPNLPHALCESGSGMRRLFLWKQIHLPTTFSHAPMIKTLRKKEIQPRSFTYPFLGPTGFVQLHYTEWGPLESERTVLCVHGLTRNGRDFDFLARHLAHQGMRVIAPDLPGRGRSEWLPSANDYATATYLAAMTSLVCRLNVPEVDWVGTSLGGHIGMEFAARLGAPVRRLVLNDFGARLQGGAVNRLGRYARMAKQFSNMEDFEQHLRTVYQPFGELTDEQWRHMTEHSAMRNSEGYYRRNFDPAISIDFMLWPALIDITLWHVWDKVQCPVLILRGETSDLLLTGTVDRMKERGIAASHGRVESVTIPNCGHAPALMNLEQVQLVEEFLTRDNMHAEAKQASASR